MAPPHPSLPSSRHWSRRRFLRTAAAGAGTIAFGGVLAGCGDSSDSSSTAAAGSGGGSGGGTTAGPTTVNVGMGWIKNVEYGGSWIALDRGFYDEESIVAEYLQGGPNAPTSPVAVASGDAHIGVSASMLTFVDSVLEGNDFVCFASQYQDAPGAVLSLADRPIRTPEDLVGVRFLGQEGVDVQLDAVFRIAGLEADYEFIPAGFTPDPLIEGQGDAYSCFAVNQPITLELDYGLTEGVDFFVTPWSQLGLPTYSNVFFAERSWLDANRDAVVGFMRATIKGWEANEADPAVAAALAAETYGADLGLDLDQQTRQNELQIPFMQSDLTASSGLFRLDPERWEGPMYAGFRAAGRTDLPPASQILDLTILDDVFGDASRLLP